MMNLGTFDHLTALILIVVLPVYAFFEHKRLQRLVAEGVPGARAQVYATTIIVQWVLALGVLAFWVPGGRELTALGLGFETGLLWWIGAGVTVVIIALLSVQSVCAIRSGESMEKVCKQVEPLRALLPESEHEARLFNVVSVTAGICEEFLYRGYLIAYFGAFTDTWLAVILSSLAFGIGHSYQGVTGIAKTGAIGLALAGLYMLTGSLWAPMLLHAFVDVNSGYLGRRALAQASA